MYYKFIRYISAFIVLFSSISLNVAAQPCADTQPQIYGAQSVTNSQNGVIYSTPNIPGHTYSWSITRGIIISGAGTNQVMVKWGGTGTGTISVTETNPALSCSTTINKLVQIRPYLVSYIYYTNESCYGDQLSFFADSSKADPANPIVSYEWDFGDGQTSTLKSPLHAYGLPWNQTWTVRLIVTNDSSYKDTIYDAVYVNPNQYIPSPDFLSDIPSCGYDAVQFDASISTTPPGTNPIWKYVWDYGDPASGASNHDSLKVPLTSHVFSAPGTYTIKLRIGNDKSCQNEITKTITVLPSIPAANYAYSTPTCINNPTFFTDMSTAVPVHNNVTWTWNFGDGSNPVVVNSPASPNISHIYPGLGPYNTWLKVTNDIGCSDSIFKQITLTPSPIADFKNLSNCVGDTVHFTSTSLTNNGPQITSYNWNFGDPASGFNTSTNQNPTHMYSTAGFYNVTLIIQNTAGCPDTLVKTIQVFDPPAVEYTYVIGPQNNAVQFHLDQFVTPIGRVGHMLQWDFGDGTYANGQYDPVHIYPAGGLFNVTLTVTDTNGCTNHVTHAILVPTVPLAFFSSNSPVCFGQPLCVTDFSSAQTEPFGWIATYVWNWGDGTPNDTIHFPNDPNLCHIYSIADTFAITLTVYDNNGFSDDFTREVIIMNNPVANFFFTDGCATQIISFTDASFANGAGNIISWKWNFGDPISGIDNTSNLQNPIHIFNTGGLYTVRLIVENFDGCSDTMIKQVPVRFSPPVDFVFDTVCLNNVTTFNGCSGVTLCDSIATWSWDFGDGFPLSSDPITTSHLYTTPGVYTVKLTVVDIHGCRNFITHDIHVNPLPIAAFSWSVPACQDVSIQFHDESLVPAGFTGFVAKWKWDFGDGSAPVIVTIPGSPNISHTFPNTSTSYPVTLQVWTADSCTQTITHTINLTPAPLANFSFSAVNCLAQAVSFTDETQTNGGGSIVFWDWNFGDPGSGVNNTSTNQSPTHNYLLSGTYNVTLIVKNVTGCTDTIVKPITIAAPPFSSFTADTACVNNTTTFTYNFPVTGISSFLWNFGDGNTSTVANPTHTYSTYGIYTVTLHIVNTAGCVDDTSRQVLVNPDPIAAFSYTAPNCLGAPVQYTDLSSTVTGYLGHIQTWVWNFDDGTTPVTITFPSPASTTHVFAGYALNHLVTLTVTTSDGCTNTISHNVTSIPAPIANFSIPTSNCEEHSVQFMDISQPNGGGSIVTWNWNFGDPTSGGNNTSTAQNPIHFFNNPGTYAVTLIVSNSSGCRDTIVNPNVAIIQNPVANFTADTACLHHITTFNCPAITNVNQWSWDFGDGGTANIQNPTHQYSASGVYPVTLTVTTNEGCTHDTTKSVLVIGEPNAAFTTSAPACASDSVAFTNLSTTPHGSIVTWLWDFGDGNTVTRTGSQNPNVKHKYATGGTYNVTLTITTSDQCTDPTSQQVNINFAPLANFDYAVTRCEGEGVLFTDLSQPNGGGAISQWEWDFGDPASGTGNTSNLQNPTHFFSAGGQFWVKLTITNPAGCTAKDSAQVSVDEAPVAIFSADTACIGSNTQFTDASTSPAGTTVTAWTWDFGDPSSGANNNSTLQNPTHSYAAPGTYSVLLTITNSNSCHHDTVVQVEVYPKPQALYDYTPACVNSETQFTDLSIAPGSMITAWAWDFGDGTGTSNVQNPTYTYTTAGTYQVKLVVTNLSNCQDSVTMAVTTRPTPTAAYNYSTFFCPAGQVNFQDMSTGAGSAIVDRLWTFEPGYTSNVPNPVHVFTNPGQKYWVTLIVTDNYGCQDTIGDSVDVKPGFQFTFNNDTVCFKNPTHFTPVNLATGDTLYSVSWNFGNPDSGPNNISYQYSPTHIFTQPGQYVVMLKATNSDNCVDSVYHTITVHALPQPTFTFTSEPCDSIIRFNESAIAGSGTISSWDWTFGDGSPNVVIPSPGPGDTAHQYTIGTYPVLLKVTNSYGCVDTLSQMVELYPCIMADFTHGDTLICSRYPISFADSSLPAARINSWHWEFGDGTDTTYTTHAGNVIHTYPAAATYNVKLIIDATVSGRSFTDSLIQVVTVHPTPLPGFLSSSVCLNQVTLFQDTTLNYGAPVTNWSWDFGHPSSGVKDTSTFQNPQHKYDTAGLYPVELLTINQYGCKDSVTQQTKVFELPQARFHSTIACASSPTYFNDATILGDTAVTMWHWNFGVPDTKQDTSLIEDPFYQYKMDGQYTVRLIVKDMNGCLDTVDSAVTVLVSPLSAFTVTDKIDGMTGKVQLNNLTTGADVYYWDFGNGHHSTEENPVATFENDGTYQIMLISSNQHECSDTTFYKYEVLFKGLYIPNAFAPTSNNISVMLFKPAGINLKTYLIEVYDQWGHQVWISDKIDLDGHPTEGWDGKDLNGNLLPSGTYMWKVKASFIDGSEWQGSDIGRGEYNTMGTVTLVR